MGAPKGNRFSPGRPKGSKDKKTEQWEKFSEWFLSTGLQKLEREVNKLEGKDFVLTVKDMLEYFKPKLARSEITGKDGEALQITPIYAGHSLPGHDSDKKNLPAPKKD